MTLYNKIKQYLGYGLVVVVQNKYGSYRIFHRITPENKLEATQIAQTIEESLRIDSFLWDEEKTNKCAEEYGWRIYDTIPRPITPYPVGMKVRIDTDNPEVKKIASDLDTKKIFNIIGYYQDYKGRDRKEMYELSSGTGQHFYLYHSLLIPVLEEEKDTEMRCVHCNTRFHECTMKVCNIGMHHHYEFDNPKDSWLKEGKLS